MLKKPRELKEIVQRKFEFFFNYEIGEKEQREQNDNSFV